jgi:hypothetical protein
MTSATAETAPGWYLDPSKPSTERYWTGGQWVPGLSREATTNAQPVPKPSVVAHVPSFEKRLLAIAAEQSQRQATTAAILGWILGLQVAGILAVIVVYFATR